MSVWPDAPAVRAFLARVARRTRILRAMEGAAIGLAIAFLIALAAVVLGGAGPVTLLALALAGSGVGALVAAARTPAPASLVERRAPQSRNIVWTAAELMAAPARVPPYVGVRVTADAAAVVRSLDARALFPARRALLALGTMLLAWVATAALVLSAPDRLPSALAPALPGADRPEIARIEVTVTTPAYAGGTARTLVDPDRIEALAGSRIVLRVEARAAVVRIATIATRDTLRREGDAFLGSMVLDADGYIAVEAAAPDGSLDRRLIGVVAALDRAPVVRITTPGRDLAVPDGDRTFEIAVEANDDLAVDALGMTFTRVSGSGEQHTFLQGVVPLAITRDGQAAGRGRGTLRLDTLGLEPGDMVVYRAWARDRRPDAPPAESDAFIVEVTAPGDVPAEGFSSDDEDRYALSQQMVLVKTERLIARVPSLPADSVAEQAAAIAAEQRAVRAEFVFMMGGELEDDILPEASMDDLNEAAHAELDDEAIAGRLRNRGRLDLLSAIRAMSRANTALLAGDLGAARDEERAAIDLLQRAFSRTRYILRALTQRERLDLERRLTGDLGGVGTSARAAAVPTPSQRVTALRRALAEVAALAGADPGERAAAANAAALALLRIDAASDALRGIAADLDAAAAALRADRARQARELLDRAATALAERVRAEVGRPVAAPMALEAARLGGALTDALRRSQ